MKKIKVFFTILLCISNFTLFMGTPSTVYAAEASDEELLNDEAEAVAEEEGEPDTRIIGQIFR